MDPKPQYPAEQTGDGEFRRQKSAFRKWCGPGDDCEPEPGRYHLYVSYACPWAHRTIIFRKLKRLEDMVGMTVVDPIRDERGWMFRDGPGHSIDPINGFQSLSSGIQDSQPLESVLDIVSTKGNSVSGLVSLDFLLVHVDEDKSMSAKTSI